MLYSLDILHWSHLGSSCGTFSCNIYSCYNPSWSSQSDVTWTNWASGIWWWFKLHDICAVPRWMKILQSSDTPVDCINVFLGIFILWCIILLDLLRVIHWLLGHSSLRKYFIGISSYMNAWRITFWDNRRRVCGTPLRLLVHGGVFWQTLYSRQWF